MAVLFYHQTISLTINGEKITEEKHDCISLKPKKLIEMKEYFWHNIDVKLLNKKFQTVSFHEKIKKNGKRKIIICDYFDNYFKVLKSNKEIYIQVIETNTEYQPTVKELIEKLSYQEFLDYIVENDKYGLLKSVIQQKEEEK